MASVMFVKVQAYMYVLCVTAVGTVFFAMAQQNAHFVVAMVIVSHVRTIREPVPPARARAMSG